MRSVTEEEAVAQFEVLLAYVETGEEVEIRRGDMTIACISKLPRETTAVPEHG